MSKVSIGSVVAVVVVVVVLAGLWTVKRPGQEPQDPGTPKQAAGSPAPAAQPAQTSQPAEPDPLNPEDEPAVQLPAIPTPTADWLRAPANPQRVSVQLNERTVETRVTPAGATLSTTMTDGTRVTLVFPRGSLWRSEEITIQVVEGLEGSPFGAAPIAVTISPANLPLRRAPLLRIEPGRRSSFDGKGTVAGFAVRGGTELSLYPAGRYEIDRAPGRYRIAMVLTRLGTYGVTNATPAEIDALGKREPTDLAARLELRIATAYAAGASNGQPSSTVAGWTILPAVHAQGGVSLFIYDLLKQLLEYYQQVVVPKFDKLPTSDCLSGATFDAIQTYLQWRASVELLLPMQKEENPELLDEHSRLAAQREQMLRDRGFTPDQIGEIDRAVEQFREQFDRMSAAITTRILPALRAQFSALYRCCTTQRPMEYHLTAMMKILRFGELNGYMPVDPDPMPKVMECACLVGANRPGANEQFTGMLSYEENTSFNKTQQVSSRTIVNSETRNFLQSSVLTFPRPDGTMIDSNAGGTLVQSASVTDDHGTCVVHNESRLEVDGRDTDVGMVSINVNVQRGSYTLALEYLPVEGSGSRRSQWNVKGPGCGKFNKPRDETTAANQGISPVPLGTVSGRLDPSQPHVLKGAHVFERADHYYGATRQASLKWDIQRCKR